MKKRPELLQATQMFTKGRVRPLLGKTRDLLLLTFLLISCGTTTPPIEKQPKLTLPSIHILVDFSSKLEKTFLRSEAYLRSEAEKKGVELFFQDLNGTGPLNGIRFKKKFSPKTIKSTTVLSPCKESRDSKILSRTKFYCKPQSSLKSKKPEIISRTKSSMFSKKSYKKPSSSRKKDPEISQTTPSIPKKDHIAGIYLGKSQKNRKAFLERMNYLPIVSCDQSVQGRNVTSFNGFDEGAARKALISLKNISARKIVLVSDNSDFGKRGRGIIRRLSKKFGISLRLVTILSNDPNSFLSVFENDPTFPVLAWLNQAKLKNLIQAARQINHTGIILLGPTAVHPNLALRSTEISIASSLGPLYSNSGETIFAVGHKIVVAKQLNDKDQLKRSLERFHDMSLSVYEEPPKLFTACAYDALLFLIESLTRSIIPKREIPSSIGRIMHTHTWKHRNFLGILGSYAISEQSQKNHQNAKLGPNAFTLLRAYKTKWVQESMSNKGLSGFTSPTYTPTRALSPSVEISIPSRTNQKSLPLNIRKY